MLLAQNPTQNRRNGNDSLISLWIPTFTRSLVEWIGTSAGGHARQSGANGAGAFVRRDEAEVPLIDIAWPDEVRASYEAVVRRNCPVTCKFSFQAQGSVWGITNHSRLISSQRSEVMKAVTSS